MAEDRLVEIKNMTNGTLVYKVPALNVRREFLPGMSKKIKYDELQEALLDNGIRTMFRLNYLACTNKKDGVDLEIYEPDQDVDTMLDAAHLTNLLKSGKNSEIYLVMKKATKPEQDKIISILVKERISDTSIVKWCKDFFHYDLLSALSLTQVTDD